METIELLRDTFSDDIFTYTEPEIESLHPLPSSHTRRSSHPHRTSNSIQPVNAQAPISMGIGHAVPGDSFLHAACRAGCLGFVTF